MYLSRELELTPSQRETFKDALTELKAKLRELKPELAQSRGDVAQVMRSEDFDVELLGSLFARQDDVITEVRKEVTGALGSVHAVLDDVQRERLAKLLERGPRGW